jgi:hypothetical protein
MKIKFVITMLALGLLFGPGLKQPTGCQIEPWMCKAERVSDAPRHKFAPIIARKPAEGKTTPICWVEPWMCGPYFK